MAELKGHEPRQAEVTVKPDTDWSDWPDALGINPGISVYLGSPVTVTFPDVETGIAFYKWLLYGAKPGIVPDGERRGESDLGEESEQELLGQQ